MANVAVNEHKIALSHFGIVQLALEALLRCSAVAQLLLQLRHTAAAGVGVVRGGERRRVA